MKEIFVREMKLGDWVGLKRNVYTDMEENQIKENVLQNIKDIDKNKNWVYLVAELDNEVVGTTYIKTGGTSAANKHIAELYSVVVASDYRNRGICRTMIRNAKEVAKKRGAEIITVSVREGTLADTVYQRLGFIPYGNLINGIKDNKKYYNQKLLYQDII